MLVYCDFIADRIRKALVVVSNNAFMEPVALTNVGKIEWDLDEDGSFVSPKKTMIVTDGNGKSYRIIVEEV
jgi:hypothetical protein